MKKILLPILLTVFLTAQDITPYYESLNKGNVEEIRANISMLKEKYPDSPAVMYLDALSTERAEDAVIIYKMLVQRYPNSEYTADSEMKIGEYLYARGLYTQASKQFAKVPKTYPHSKHVQRAIDLQINSLLASGEKDSVDFYLQVYKNKFPKNDLSYNFKPDKPVVSRTLEENIHFAGKDKKSTAPTKVIKKESSDKVPASKPKPVTEASISNKPKPYVVQVGAYGSVNNALRQKQLLEQMGYVVDIVPIKSRGKTLQAIQIVRYENRSEAENIGKKIKNDLGYNFIVLKRPEK